MNTWCTNHNIKTNVQLWQHDQVNYCKKWTIRDENDTPYDFCDIYSDNPGTVDGIIDEVEKVWETRYANGRMKRI